MSCQLAQQQHQGRQQDQLNLWQGKKRKRLQQQQQQQLHKDHA